MTLAMARQLPRGRGSLQRMICFNPRKRLIRFNDRSRTTHADVMALFDRTIQHLANVACLHRPMTPLQTTVLMKTDIAGSTPRFRALLAADLQALVLEHRAFIAQHAAAQGGEIVRLEGDGYWLKFPSVTGAAKSAIAMQETLRLTQTNKGDDRIAMRIVIGLGDIAFQENDLIGDMLALVVRVEAITPADEIYLTSAARLALTSSEVQTALVDNFVLKGFVEPIPVYRVEQRHRTRIIDDAYILVSDLRGFTRLTETQPVGAIEGLLDTLDALAHRIAHEFDGTIRFSFFVLGDRGLIVLSSCGHAGIINTLRRAQEITGIDKIYALVGGFHLAPAPDDYLRLVMAELKKFDLEHVLPMHCSGQNFIDLAKQEMPEKLVICGTGSTYTFTA